MKAIRSFSRGIRSTPHSTFRKNSPNQDEPNDEPKPFGKRCESSSSDHPNAGTLMVNQSGNAGGKMRAFGYRRRTGRSARPRATPHIDQVETMIGSEQTKTQQPPEKPAPVSNARTPFQRKPLYNSQKQVNSGEQEMAMRSAEQNRPAWNKSLKMEPINDHAPPPPPKPAVEHSMASRAKTLTVTSPPTPIQVRFF